jgi:phage gp46-like protein
MVDDGVAQSVSVTAEWGGVGRMNLKIDVQRPKGKVAFNYDFIWAFETARE